MKYNSLKGGAEVVRAPDINDTVIDTNNNLILGNIETINAKFINH